MACLLLNNAEDDACLPWMFICFSLIKFAYMCIHVCFLIRITVCLEHLPVCGCLGLLKSGLASLYLSLIRV